MTDAAWRPVKRLQAQVGAGCARSFTAAAWSRLTNPVLMTALSAGLALIPLALAGGEPGNEIQSPMVVVVLGGLLTAVVLNMLVVPALFLRYGVERPGAGGTAARQQKPQPVRRGWVSRMAG